MRNFLLLFVVWALASAPALCSTDMFSEEPSPTVSIEQGKDFKSLDVRMINLNRNTTEVTIQAFTGKVWFRKYLTRDDGFAARLKLDGMPEGDYIVYVKQRDNLWMEAFTLYPDQVVLFDNPAQGNTLEPQARFVSETTEFKGRMIAKFDSNHEMNINVRLANLQSRPTMVKLMCMGGLIHHRQKVKGHDGYAIPYNMEGMLPSPYCIYINGYDATVIQCFDVTDEGIALMEVRRMEKPMHKPAIDEYDDIITMQ